MEKPAHTEYPIHALLQSRWSPRAFAAQAVAPEQLLSLFEAARWSPSGGNLQPWSFVVTTQADPEPYQKLVGILTGRNPLWATSAPVLVLAVAKTERQPGTLNRYAYYDLGQAVAHLSVQATALGLAVHQMAGFDAAKAREIFEIPEGYEPATVIAIGYQGSADTLPDILRESELGSRTRKPLAEFVFDGHWNAPLTLETDEAITNH